MGSVEMTLAKILIRSLVEYRVDWWGVLGREQVIVSPLNFGVQTAGSILLLESHEMDKILILKGLARDHSKRAAYLYFYSRQVTVLRIGSKSQKPLEAHQHFQPDSVLWRTMIMITGTGFKFVLQRWLVMIVDLFHSYKKRLFVIDAEGAYQLPEGLALSPT